ncbi:MAG: ROK family protein [Candidatus Bathyarchaeia archaeon]
MVSEMFSYVISLDVGGTSLKSAIIRSDGLALDGSFQKVPIDSLGSAETIIETFVKVLRTGLQLASSRELELRGIGIAMPGPFDYAEGVSLMGQGFGLEKFRAIYGINLRREFIKRLDLREDFPIIFEPDSWAFLRGEAWLGAARGYSRALGITLGTGLGSAFMVNGEIVIEGPGIPPLGWIAMIPYKDGVIEDRVSRRGILTRYRELSGRSVQGLDVADIALQASNGDKVSLQVFEETGLILGKVLKRICLEFKPECLVIGGQISKSLYLFERALKTQLGYIPSLRKIAPACSIDLSPLYGVANLMFKGSKSPAWTLLKVAMNGSKTDELLAKLKEYVLDEENQT